MKRRNIDCGKRRPLKRSHKFTEGVYGSSFVYVKFFMIWCAILLADFVLEFRFEYVWPFWLLLRSVFDSFKYQGLAFSVFFVCIAITSDVICLLFIPLDWLFFMASTYVWVQYVWHTEKGICLPTISLWAFFMYIEAALRLKDFKQSSFPFHVDLCRPFAAHCIGYPVVTLGFGFKGYVSYRLRLRTQRDVQKENEFYYELIKQALPTEIRDHQSYLPIEEKQSNSITGSILSSSIFSHLSLSNSKKDKDENTPRPATLQVNGTQSKHSTATDGSPSTPVSKTNNTYNNNTTPVATNGGASLTRKIIQHHNNNLQTNEKVSQTGNDETETEIKKRNTSSSNSSSNGNSSPKSNHKKSTNSDNSIPNGSATHQNSRPTSRSSSVTKPTNATVIKAVESNGHIKTNNTQDKQNSLYSEAKYKMKQDALRIDELQIELTQLKSQLESSKKAELKLGSQITSLTNSEKLTRNEIINLKSDNDELQMRLHNLVTTKQKDKQNIQNLEKRIKQEAEQKSTIEKQLDEERKKRKAEEDINRAKETIESFTKTIKAKEKEIEKITKQLKESEENRLNLKNQVKELKEAQKNTKETETLMSALAAMKEKNMMLQKSLSAETRLKLDLFSALGDAKRRMEIMNGIVYKRDAEITELKSRVAEALSVLPESQVQCHQYSNGNFIEKQQSPAPFSPTQHYSAAFCPVPNQLPPMDMAPVNIVPSSNPQQIQAGVVHLPLDPTAAVYTPPVTSNII